MQFQDLHSFLSRQQVSFLFFSPPATTPFLKLAKPLLEKGYSIGFGDPFWILEAGLKLSATSWEGLYLLRVKVKEPCILSFSSGTGTSPKPLIRTLKSWQVSFALIAPLLSSYPQAKGLCVGSLAHSLPLFGCLESLFRQQQPYLLRTAKIKSFSKQKANYQYVLWTTPVHLKYFLDVAKKRDSHLKTSLKVLFVGGAPLSPIYKKTLQKTFPNAILYEFFGSSETSFISIKTPQDPPLSVGSVCEGVQVSIRDSTHLPMPPETTGMLWVKSPQLFLGYLGDTPLQKHEGFISVGDFGRLSSDGKLYFEGRSSGWTTISGNTFNLFRLESALKTILKVEPLVLMVKPHTQKEHQLVVVVSRPIQIDLIQKMRATIRKRFGSHCVPKKIKVCSNWPLLRSGKIDRKALLKQL